jgi:hypothetical protein
MHVLLGSMAGPDFCDQLVIGGKFSACQEGLSCSKPKGLNVRNSDVTQRSVPPEPILLQGWKMPIPSLPDLLRRIAAECRTGLFSAQPVQPDPHHRIR